MGVTLVDAGVLIGFLQDTDSHHASSVLALEEARSRGDRIVVPASAYSEVLVGPLRKGFEAAAVVQAFCKRVPIDVVPLDENIAYVAATLRAKHRGKLKFPNALVIATALHHSVDVLVSTDRQWPSREALGFRGSFQQL
jgi:predicted nucleic acid-binding protein